MKKVAKIEDISREIIAAACGRSLVFISKLTEFLCSYFLQDRQLFVCYMKMILMKMSQWHQHWAACEEVIHMKSLDGATSIVDLFVKEKRKI